MKKESIKNQVKEMAKCVAKDVVTGLALMTVCLAVKKVSGIDMGNLKPAEDKRSFLDEALKKKRK